MATLAELTAKAQAGTITADEKADLLKQMADAQNLLASLQAVGKQAGLVVADDELSKSLRTIGQDYAYQREGNYLWHMYRMERITSAYNTVAAKHKLPLCNDASKLGDVLASLPAHLLPAVKLGLRTGREKADGQWPKEFVEYAKILGKPIRHNSPFNGK